MRYGESISNFFSRTMTIVNKMHVHVCFIEGSKNVYLLSIDELQGSLLQDNEEQALQASSNSHHSSSNKKGRGKGSGRGRNSSKGRGHGRYQSTTEFSKSTYKLNVKCYRYKGYEHYQNECRTNLSNDNGEKSNLLSIGQLLEMGYEITINDSVCCIHDVNLDLIAQVKIKINRIFPLYLNNVPNTYLSTRLKNDAWLWHFRYGHLNFGGLKTLQQKEMVVGLPNFPIPMEVCEEYVTRKQHREPFPKRNTEAARNCALRPLWDNQSYFKWRQMIHHHFY
ncbi:hypothetical protein CR513_53202, partial [Mucuna pruriens]